MSNVSEHKDVKPGIQYITGNLKYPDYIRNHEVFHKLNKIAKVFPSIGLPNTQEECQYNNLSDSRQDATNLLVCDVRNAIYPIIVNLGEKPLVSDVARSFYNLISNYYQFMIVEEENRIAIKFQADCGMWENKPFAKKGESFFKAYNKLIELCKEQGPWNLTPLESMPSFKNFSSSNIGNKKYKLVFSSEGEEGAWDIATISMRGINSCQTWTTPQSRGLIGSMSSRYVGVIYITNGEKFNEYGSRMLRRTMVRFAINRVTKKPALLLDRVYPADCPTARKLFKDFLSKKTNLPVLFSGETDWNNYSLPSDGYWKFVPMAAQDYTYMDTKISWLRDNPTSAKNVNSYYAHISQVDNNLRKAIQDTISKMADEYCANKKVHTQLFKGGVANLLISLRRQHGKQNHIIIALPQLYDYATAAAWMPRVNDCDNAVQYELRAVRAALTQVKVVDEAIKHYYTTYYSKLKKFYPNSFDKLRALIIMQYKHELLKIYKNLLKK